MLSKRELTKKIIDEFLPDYDFSHALTHWWWVPHTKTGYRLTSVGYTTFTELVKAETFKYSLKGPLPTLKLLLDLDRKLPNPYYLFLNKTAVVGIAFFNGKDAMLFTLHDNLDRFLANYTETK